MKTLLIDGLNLVRRIHAAVPGDPGADAHAEGVLRSCLSSLSRALEAHGPSHAMCVFDHGGPSWRHELWPPYKADRPPMPADLAQLLPGIQQQLGEAGAPAVTVAGFEADDVLASIAVRVATHGGEAVILSTDQSLCQVLQPGIRVYDHFAHRDLDAEFVRQRSGVTPHQLALWKALAGDASMGYPGVPGVGPKRAATLIQDFGELEAIVAPAETVPPKLRRALQEQADLVHLGVRLFTLRTDVEAGLNLQDFRYHPPFGDSHRRPGNS